METDEKKNLTRMSFFNAARDLSELCNRIDNSQTEDEELFSELILQLDPVCQALSEAIDRRKFIIREAESKIELARSYKRSIDETIKRLQKVQEKLTEATKFSIEANPNIPYKDSLGNKLTVRKNSNPSLILTLDLRDSKAISNLLDESSISLLEIDEKYIKKVSFLTLDTEKVKSDLVTGTVLPWASLYHGTHVRGLK